MVQSTSTINKNSNDQTYLDRADSFAQESAQLHTQLKKGLPSNRQGFVPNTSLDPDCNVAHAVHTALSMCCPEPSRDVIRKQQSKQGRFGEMVCIGYGGQHVNSKQNRGYFSAPVGSPITMVKQHIAHALWDTLEQGHRNLLFHGVIPQHALDPSRDVPHRQLFA